MMSLASCGVTRSDSSLKLSIVFFIEPISSLWSPMISLIVLMSLVYSLNSSFRRRISSRPLANSLACFTSSANFSTMPLIDLSSLL